MSQALVPSLGLTDTALLDALLRPDDQGNYPADSRPFVRIDCSLRAYWHAIFDAVPDLLQLDAPDGLNLFREFMRWADTQQLSMDWSLYIQLHNWLTHSHFAPAITVELSQALYCAAAARWATADRSEAIGIALGSPAFNELILGWKCDSLEGGREVEMFELADSLPAPEASGGFFTLAERELDSFPGWQPIV